MHAVDLIAAAVPIAELEPLISPVVQDVVCCVTGQRGNGVLRKDLFGKSFTDQSLLRAPESQYVGLAAWTALSYKWERMGSWWCDGDKFRKLSRQDVRRMVLGYTPSANPWAGYITTSYKKHGALRAPVNSGHRQVWLFEMRLVDCTDRDKLRDWWAEMNDALRAGISRRSMEALDMPPGIIRTVGIDVWETYREWAQDKWQSPMYGLCCYLLPSADELKAEKEEGACSVR